MEYSVFTTEEEEGYPYLIHLHLETFCLGYLEKETKMTAEFLNQITADKNNLKLH